MPGWVITRCSNTMRSYEEIRKNPTTGSALKGSKSSESRTTTKCLFVTHEDLIGGRSK